MNVLSLQASGRGGCTMSLLCAEDPNVFDLLEAAGINMLRHPIFSRASGEVVRRLLNAILTGEQPLDVLCVERAIAQGPKGTGRYNILSGTGQPMMTWVQDLGAVARHVVAVGTCAAYGGVTSAGSNPSDSVGLHYDGAHPGGIFAPDFRSRSGLPVINVAGCPTHPGWVTETLLPLASGQVTAADFDALARVRRTAPRLRRDTKGRRGSGGPAVRHAESVVHCAGLFVQGSNAGADRRQCCVRPSFRAAHPAKAAWMSGPRLIVGPLNRVEGDLEVSPDFEDGAVRAAYVISPLCRGFERMLEDKVPSDDLTLTPRICGICSISQSAAARSLAQGITPTPQGARMAALIHAVENAADHLTHFHLFFIPDFTRPAYADRSWHGRVVERFTAMAGSAQRMAVEPRAALRHILGPMAGKWPHTLAIQPSGVAWTPTLREKVRIETSQRAFRRYLEAVLFGGRLEDFASLPTQQALMGWQGGDVGLFLQIAAEPDLATMGKGGGRYLSFCADHLEDGLGFARGVWDKGPRPLDTALIREDLSHAWMLGEAAHPSQGRTFPDQDMRETAYTWRKAPRLSGQTMETGALARQVIEAHPLALDLAQQGGVLARVAARPLKLERPEILMENLTRTITPEALFISHTKPAEDDQGEGLVEAARGALGHWLRIERGRIASYKIIAPTTWNFSPRDAAGVPKPLEAALARSVVAAGETAPLSVQHIMRSFDPSMICTVH